MKIRVWLRNSRREWEIIRSYPLGNGLNQIFKPKQPMLILEVAQDEKHLDIYLREA